MEESMHTYPKARISVFYLFVILGLVIGATLAPITVHAQDETPGSPDPTGVNESSTGNPDPGSEGSADPSDPSNQALFPGQESGSTADQPDPATGYLGTAEAESSPEMSTYPGQAAYDSGWLNISAGESLLLTHGLGGSIDNYVVDLRFNSISTTMESHGYNQLGFGGNQLISPPPAGYAVDDSVGAYWHSLTTSTVKVYRMPQDKTYADRIRLRIWVITSAGYDSGWVSTTPGSPYTLNFSITNGNANNYLVYMEFKDTGLYVDPSLSLRIHQRYYGGFSLAGNTMVGAYWRSLTDSSIVAYVRTDETRIDQVRVRIWNQPQPTYDSGWFSGSAGYYVRLYHDLGGNPDDYIVDLQYTDLASVGINQRCYGGCDLRANDGSFANTKQGAYWRNLTDSIIEVGRRSQDTFAVQMRVRIWNVWTPTRPDYDSDWNTNSTGSTEVVHHNLGGNEDDYLVNFMYNDWVFNANQLYYGIKTFGAKPPAYYSENDMGGAYWRSLTNSSLTVYRASNDKTVDQWRVRIWRMPKPDYDSGWVSIPAGNSSVFDHNLVGDRSDFLIDVTCKDDDVIIGKNQRFLGGSVTYNDLYYGVHWFGFNATTSAHSLTVYRYPNDLSAEQVRVRIWRVNTPDYESGYQAYATGQLQFFSHNLDAEPENMLVDATANQTSGDHKVFYGRIDIGATSPFMGYAENDRAGFYWYNLTRTGISAQRLPEDRTSLSINLRIWKLPFITFIPFVSR